MNPLVTIAIASYNNAKYIERCLVSVFTQSYSNLEVLLVDDGSTDDTLQRIKRFKSDSRLSVILKENGGLSTVRQRALEEAKGDFICFIDADDYLSITYIEFHLNNIINTNADISVCSSRFEMSDGTYLQGESKGFRCSRANVALKLEANYLNNGTFPYNISLSDSWNKMYRASFIQKTGVQFALPKGYNGTDTAFNWKLALYEPSYSTIAEEEYIHVVYNSSAVHRKKKKLYEGFKIITEQLIATSKLVDKEELFRPAISRFYYTYTRMAVTDMARESESYNECNQIIRNFITEHRMFVNVNHILDIFDFKKDIDFKIIVFLMSRVPALLSGYLFIRTRLVRIIH